MDNVKTGQLISELRKSKGLTQQQLADQMNLSNKTISKWESGLGAPDLSNLLVLADALDVTADELLRGELDSDSRKEPEDKAEEPIPKSLSPTQNKERALIALAMCIGATLGILAYNLGWLG